MSIVAVKAVFRQGNAAHAAIVAQDFLSRLVFCSLCCVLRYETFSDSPFVLSGCHSSRSDGSDGASIAAVRGALLLISVPTGLVISAFVFLCTHIHFLVCHMYRRSKRQ